MHELMSTQRVKNALLNDIVVVCVSFSVSKCNNMLALLPVGCGSNAGRSSGCNCSGGEDGRGVKQRGKLLWPGYHLQGVCVCVWLCVPVEYSKLSEFSLHYKL